jgi:hypothetical protein
VSTLIYTVREDGAEEIARFERDRRRLAWAIFVVAMTSGPGVFLVERLVGNPAWRSFLTDALSLCLYAAVAVWYALRQRSGVAWRNVGAIYVAGLAIMGAVNLVTKGGLDAQPGQGSPARTSVLWTGALMLAFIPLLGGMARRFPIEMRRIGLSLHFDGPHRASYLLAGLGVGLFIGLHFWLTAGATGIMLDLKPWPYTVWRFSYRIGPQALPTELFLRGVVFNELYFGRNWSFWPSSLSACGLELLAVLARQDYGADLLLIVSVIFYAMIRSILNAGLYRWSRNVLPGYLNSVVFGLFSTLG